MPVNHVSRHLRECLLLDFGHICCLHLWQHSGSKPAFSYLHLVRVTHFEIYMIIVVTLLKLFKNVEDCCAVNAYGIGNFIMAMTPSTISMPIFLLMKILLHTMLTHPILRCHYLHIPALPLHQLLMKFWCNWGMWCIYLSMCNIYCTSKIRFSVT